MFPAGVASTKMKAFVALFFVLAAGLLFLGSSGMRKSYSLMSVVIPSPKTPSPHDPIANATLGFQELAVISLKSRPDRRKSIVEAARVTNLTLTILNAIKDEDVSPIYMPEGWEGLYHAPGTLGSYFSHIRVLDRIIEKQISTSLILESDVDWDMRIRESLAMVAKGVTRLMDYPFSVHDADQTSSSSPSSPYGNGWDVLWLGHCGGLGPYDGRVYPLNDPSAPPQRFEYNILAGDLPDPGIRPDHLRTVHEVRYNWCTYAYAVTLEGARKIRKLGQASSDPWDLRLNNMCRDEGTVRCATVSPQLFTAAYSKPNIHYPEGMKLAPPLTNPYNDRLAPKAGPSIQISARRNSQLAPTSPRSSWILEWQ